MHRIATALLVLLILPATAGANSTITRANDTYTVTSDSDFDTVTATVSREFVVVPRPVSLRAPDGQTYTFTTLQSFSTTLPVGCASTNANKTVTCADVGGTDADADHLVMLGGTGDDTLRVVFAGTGAQQGSFDDTRLEGGDGYDTLTGSLGPDTLIADGAVADLATDSLKGGAGADTLTCGSARDGVSYDDGRTTGIDFTIGANQAGPDGDIVTGCGSVIGTSKADTLTGDNGVNVIYGRGGDDVIRPGLGADHAEGEDGADTYSCDDFARVSGVTVDTTTGAGCDAGDVAFTFENVVGSKGEDTITTGTSANRISGLAGDDGITSGGGDDIVDGGGGADTLSDSSGNDTLAFGNRVAGVTVDLSEQDTVAGDANDYASGFENVTGTPAADMLSGTDGDNRIEGLGGDDTLVGRSGADQLDGGDGTDTTRYDDAGRAAGVSVDLRDLTGVENLVGTPFADTLTGTDGPNVIDGLDGEDTITALGGDDTITSLDAKTDTVDCGAGADSVKRDLIDLLTGCETLDPAATPSPSPAPSASATATPSPSPIPKATATLAVKVKKHRLKRLTVSGLPAGGATLVVSCKAPKGDKRSCAFKTKTRSGAGSVALKGLFKKRKLAAGTRITVKVRGDDVVARTFTVRVRAGKAPKVT